MAPQSMAYKQDLVVSVSNLRNQEEKNEVSKVQGKHGLFESVKKKKNERKRRGQYT